MVKSQEDKEKEINKVLERNLSSQKDRIKKRIAERKAKHQSRALSLTCISDDNMSSTDEKMQDLEQELENLPKLPGFDKLNQIEEVDEAGYATPPRKRNKDGQMIFFEKGKKNHKTFLFEEDKEIKRNIRRHSFSKEKRKESL